jgi:hypothetical protein
LSGKATFASPILNGQLAPIPAVSRIGRLIREIQRRVDQPQKHENAGEKIDPALRSVRQFRHDHCGDKSGKRLEMVAVRPICASSPPC